MTMYTPHEYAPSWSEIDKPLETFLLALSLITWDGRVWARHPEIALDLPAAWWVACKINS